MDVLKSHDARGSLRRDSKNDIEATASNGRLVALGPLARVISSVLRLEWTPQRWVYVGKVDIFTFPHINQAIWSALEIREQPIVIQAISCQQLQQRALWNEVAFFRSRCSSVVNERLLYPISKAHRTSVKGAW